MSRSSGASRNDVVSYFRQMRNLSSASGSTANSSGGALPPLAGSGGKSPSGIVHSVQRGQDTSAQAAQLRPGASAAQSGGGAKPRSMLPPPKPEHANKNLLVLDIDETLVHSSFRPVACDLTLPVVVDGQTYHVYIKFRPHLMTFLQEVSKIFECAIFTASLGAYANGLMDQLDPGRTMCPHRLFREHCSYTNGAYVKDMSLLGRDLNKIMIADNSPVAYLFQPRNAIPVVSWFDDPKDTELLDLLPWLRRLATANDVYPILDEYRSTLKK
eukprot:PhM_4_TR7526/c0_g1_i1/m.63588/K15731/CTDSP; carboxy-terminal domain RNA polymerase II polypeptide A small phosphatase